ncbi:MAG: SDR family oxidoreductase [Alphaproteobacteria bacterium]
MEMGLTGKRVLVTGASGGIGGAIARAFAAEGARVAVQARTPEKADLVATDIGAGAIGVSGDLADPTQARTMAADTVARLGGLDILVNNAGICETAPVEAMTQDLWDRTFAINATACFTVTQACLPAIRAAGAGASILFISSTSDKDAAAEYAAYNASKHAVRGFMRCLAVEMAPEKIRVNCVAPGWVETPMAERSRQRFVAQGKGDRDAVSSMMAGTMMLGEMIPPEAIADMTVFLASDRGAHITAQSVSVCGGTTHWG